jgi:5-methylcytosine-specific restriction endonuclease McrA
VLLLPCGDHVTPRVKGGMTKKENIKAACADCNLAKGRLSAAEFVKRIKNPQRTDTLRIWKAWSRRRIWLATHRVCKRIEAMVT